MPDEKLNSLLEQQFDIWEERKAFEGTQKQERMLRGLLNPKTQEQFESEAGKKVVGALHARLFPSENAERDSIEAGKRLTTTIRGRLGRYCQSDDPVGIKWRGLWPKIKYSKVEQPPDPTTMEGWGRRIDCFGPKDDETAIDYLLKQYKKGSVVGVRDTHVRGDDRARKYKPRTIKALKVALRMLVKQGAKVVVIFGKTVDPGYIDAARAAASLRGLECYQLPHDLPVLNCLILDYKTQDGKAKRSEVFFGWGRQGPGEQDEAVFRSDAPELVEEFSKYYEALRRASRRVKSLDALSVAPKKPSKLHGSGNKAEKTSSKTIRR